jgi:hypothetical protein
MVRFLTLLLAQSCPDRTMIETRDSCHLWLLRRSLHTILSDDFRGSIDFARHWARKRQARLSKRPYSFRHCPGKCTLRADDVDATSSHHFGPVFGRVSAFPDLHLGTGAVVIRVLPC